MTAPDDVRARFEAWLLRTYGTRTSLVWIDDAGGGRYENASVNDTFDGYRAAHADMAGEVRELVEADREYDKAATAVRKLSLSGVRDADHKHELDAALWAARERRDAALAKFHPTQQEKP